jgi:hypothetical protein
MTARRVEAMMTCPRCAKPVPLSSIAATTSCPSCASNVEVLRELWDALTAEHDGGAKVIAGSDGVWSLEFHEAAETRCPSCEEPFDVQAAIAKKASTCSKCTTAVDVRAVPRDVARKLPPEARWVIELRAHDDDHDRREAITVHCQECGAPLEIDGKERAFACTFCKARNVLSDDVWSRLHPTPVRRPFYVWIDDDAIASEQKQQEADAKTRRREAAPNELAIHGVLATLLGAGAFGAYHAFSTSEAPGWIFAALFAGVGAIIFGIFASRALRTVLAREGREDAVDIAMLAFGVAIVVSALVLHFALHASWPASCLVIAIGVSVGGGPILEAAS